MAKKQYVLTIDEEIKRELEFILEDMGMSLATAFNIFARAVVRERKIPFEIASTTKPTNQKGE